MANDKLIKLHSDVVIEVFGPNKIKNFDDPSVKKDKDGKRIETVEPKWHKTKGNRFLIKKGQNQVPEYVLEWNMVKSLRKRGKITVENVKETKKKVEDTPVKKKPELKD